MSTQITSLSWWEAAGQRAAYTALAALLPLAMLLVSGQVDVVYVLLVVALAVVASLATSLAGLPELTDRAVPPWAAILTRVVKSAAQVLVSSLGGAVLLTDVHWSTIGTAAAGAALTTLVRTLMVYLPESTVLDAGTTPDGAAIITSLYDPATLAVLKPSPVPGVTQPYGTAPVVDPLTAGD